MYGFLEYFDLNLFSIITLDDILFPWGELNFTIITMSTLGFAWIFLAQIAIPEETYQKMDDHTIESAEQTWTKIKVRTDKIGKILKRRKGLLLFSTIISFIALAVGAYFLYPSLKFPKTGALGFIYIVSGQKIGRLSIH